MRPVGIIYTKTTTTDTPKETKTMETSERIAKLEAQVDVIKEDVSELKGDVKDLHSRITTGNREIIDKIDSMEHRMQEKLKENSEASALQHKQIEEQVKKDVATISEKVNVLEKWRWMIVGGAIVLGYLIGHLEVFTKVFGIK